VHSVGQRPNLRHLCEPLGQIQGLLETVGFKKTTECMCGKRESPLNEKVHMQCWFQDVYDNLSEGGEEDYVEPDVQSEGMGKHHD